MTAKVVPIGLSVPPEWLPARAKKHWQEFYKAADSVREVMPWDVLALASLCVAWAEYREFRQFLQEEGYTFQTSIGRELRPEYWLMSEAWKRASEGMNHFGMTPMGRAGMFDN